MVGHYWLSIAEWIMSLELDKLFIELCFHNLKHVCTILDWTFLHFNSKHYTEIQFVVFF